MIDGIMVEMCDRKAKRGEGVTSLALFVTTLS
jgi:hypothetical protein